MTTDSAGASPQSPAKRTPRRQKSVDRAFMRLALLAPAAVYACGIALCLFFGQALQMPAWDVIGWTLLATLALCAIAYNHWTLLGTALLVGIAALVAWRVMEMEEIEELLLAAGEQLQYVTDFLLARTDYDPQYDTALFAFVILACALISTLVVYRLRSAFVAALFGLVLLMIEWGLVGNAILPALWPIAIGCAMVFSVRGFFRAAKRPVQAVALATAIALLTSGLSALLIPSDTSPMRAASVERVLDNFGDLFSEYTGYQRPHASFSIARVGFQPLGDRLGGAVELPDIDLLRVNTTSPGLLRGTVRNYYTGSLWTRSASIKTYRMDNPFLQSTQERIMGIDIPANEDLEGIFAREIEMSVTHLSDMSATMFTTGRVRSVSPDQGDIITNYDENGESFSKRNMLVGSSYRVSARLPATTNSAFPGIVETLTEGEDALLAPDDVLERNAFLYLGLPEGFPAWVGDVAAEAIDRAGAQSDWEKAMALRNHLRDNYTYTLTPEDPPEDVDFVAHFLQSGEGYCTYFASALAVMARTQGLPSRYVEGFLLGGSRRTTGGYLVNASQAHAWVEIYIDGIGWLSFDPTPRQTASSGANAGAGTIEEPIQTPPPEAFEELSLTDLPAPAAPFVIPWYVWPAAALLALIILFFVLSSRQARRWQAERVERRWPDPIDRTVAIWRDIQRILSLMGLGIRTGETALAWAKRVDQTFENPEGRLSTFAQAYVRAIYGGAAPDERALDKANAYRGEADVSLRKSSGRFRFLFQRALRKLPDPKARRREP